MSEGPKRRAEHEAATQEEPGGDPVGGPATNESTGWRGRMWQKLARHRSGVIAIAATLAVVALVAGVGRCGSADTTAEEHAGHDHPADTIWTCSMHPQIRQPAPGQCPICGMDLIPVEPGDSMETDPDQVVLSDRAKALAAVRTTPVRRIQSGGARVRLLGQVDYDETTLKTITAWIGGRIDRLHLDVTGERVRRGQVVATLYSPEVYAAQQDLITARRQLARMSSASELARSAARATLDSARERLRLLGIPARELERMEDADGPRRHVTVRSPFAGTVIERLATEGAYVETGSPLYRIADLTRLWVQLDAYESDLPHLAVGQTVELEIEALPGEIVEGRVAFVDPVIDPRRRTARVRIAISNPDRELRPGMFVEAVVRGEAEGENGAEAQPLVIPASAPLFTGRRSIVYVSVAGAQRPTYEARVVRLGPRVGDLYPVVAGLREGERVVTEGAFALDADLQIRGGESMMTHVDDTEPGAYDGIIAVDGEWRSALARVFAAYLALQGALANDEAEQASGAASELLAAVTAFEPTEPRDAVAEWERFARHLRMHAQRASEADTLEGIRAQLEPLTAQMVGILRVFGNPTGGALHLAYCPMAFDNRGATWIQDDESVDNAYFGAAMRTCGSVRASVGPGGYLEAPREDDGSSARRAPAGGHQH
ncbi:MAG: efflux transporter periplasmic adaptor subunit [Sandaracinus sp.]|nr:efflux transporter periplasmic adaptor subunit [Sandaracinus sp.]